ncbi:hypothetical protein L1887_22782 [Cichorium endivia]|nr:hypothetical protein L1887_22782 [Cichorium endivia]
MLVGYASPTKPETHSFKLIVPSHHFTLFCHVQNEAPVEFHTTGSHGGCVAAALVVNQQSSFLMVNEVVKLC